MDACKVWKAQCKEGFCLFGQNFCVINIKPIEDNLGKIGSVAVGISLFEIGVIVLSFILAKQYAKKDEFYRNLA